MKVFLVFLFAGLAWVPSTWAQAGKPMSTVERASLALIISSWSFSPGRMPTISSFAWGAIAAARSTTRMLGILKEHAY